MIFIFIICLIHNFYVTAVLLQEGLEDFIEHSDYLDTFYVIWHIMVYYLELLSLVGNTNYNINEVCYNYASWDSSVGRAED